LEDKVKVVSYESQCTEDDREDEEWKELAMRRVSSMLKGAVERILTSRSSGVVERVLVLKNFPKT